MKVKRQKYVKPGVNVRATALGSQLHSSASQTRLTASLTGVSYIAVAHHVPRSVWIVFFADGFWIYLGELLRPPGAFARRSGSNPRGSVNAH